MSHKFHPREEFALIELEQVGRSLLKNNPISGTGHMLVNLALQEERKGYRSVKTDLPSVIACIKRARVSMDSALRFYA